MSIQSNRISIVLDDAKINDIRKKFDELEEAPRLGSCLTNQSSPPPRFVSLELEYNYLKRFV